ncbi:secretin and TonB N-terminal domain-containing protein [Sulfuritalea sp.]|uniref:secretin and TonB N-terminal domain-containing protein n=1 Tax=Sulfuritalea sp. TaxID=2480090 RepID=UPI00286E4622|nr:secretin and TonB N-terminal domain-containing protein [Sulfuritalea sp.]
MNRVSVLFIAMAFGLAGCANDATFRRGQELLAGGDTVEGLATLQQAMREAPDNHEYRNAYFRQRELQIGQMLAQADTARQAGQGQIAEATYRKVQEIELNNERARAGLAAIEMDKRHRDRLVDAEALLKAGKVEAADTAIRSILSENPAQREARQFKRRISERSVADDERSPTLRAGFARPVSVDLRDAPVKTAFDLLSRASGINFVLDKEIRPDTKTTLTVKNTPVEDVLRLIITTSQLDYKVLNDNTLLVFPNSASKIKDYKDLMVKGFYLAHADAKQIANTIKTLVKTKDLIVDEKLNYIAMRDTPEAIRIAERLIAAQDLPEPEVLLELEVLEVGVNRLMELGIRYPEQVSYSVVGADNVAGTLRLPEWQNRNSSLVRMSITNPALILNLRKTDSDTNLLANPRIRVKNREKAKIHIGERVPVITTTSTANVGVSEAVSYLDVGLKLEVEPNISLADDVAIKVGLEVSNILETITRASGLQTYRLGTRNATTALRLRDSETQVLAGLIQEDERRSANKVPGLGDLPILGRLFSSNNNTNIKTEIVLLITPRIVRNLSPGEAGTTGYFSGTESMIGAPPLRLKSNELATGAKPMAAAVPQAIAQPTPGAAAESAAIADGTVPASASATGTPPAAPPQTDAAGKPVAPLPSAFAAPAAKR